MMASRRSLAVVVVESLMRALVPGVPIPEKRHAVMTPDELVLLRQVTSGARLAPPG